MSKQNNTLLLGAGAGLALLFVLSGNKDQDKPIPKISAPTKGSPTDFIKTYYPFALQASKQFPQVPVQLILAFSGLESGWGKSAPQYNFFGTKIGPNYKGKSQLFDTTEVLPKATGYNFPKVYSVQPYVKDPSKYLWKVQDRFRAFDNPTDAFLDFAKFISSGRYKKAWTASNIKDQIIGLQQSDNSEIAGLWKAGYATDPKYPDKIYKLVQVINKVIAAYYK